MLIFTPVGGILGDRYNKARIMYICDYLKGAMILLTATLMLLFRDPGTHIVFLFVLGIGGNAVSGVFTPASGALLPQIVEEEKLQQANAFFAMKSSLESILGILLAGILYAALPICTLFFLVGLCFVTSGISEMFIRYKPTLPREHLTLRLAVGDMRDGIHYLKAKKAIMALLGAILFINFFVSPFTGNFLPYFVKTDLANAPSYLGDKALTPELWSSVINVCFGISSLVGAAILSARAQEEKCGHRTALRLCGFAVVMIVLSVSYWKLVAQGVSLNGFLITLCLGALAMGFLISCINIPISTVMMRIVDRDKLSKVTSITSIGAQGMIPVASVLAGAILKGMGSAALLAFCSFGFTLTAVLMLVNRHIREF